jgi:hypothetical protein
MTTIRVIKTTTQRIITQHVPSELYDDTTLPISKNEVLAEALASHEALNAAGIVDAAQLDIVGGQLTIDATKPAFVRTAAARRQAAVDKISTLPGDGAVPQPIRDYLLAIVDVLGVGPGHLQDPNYYDDE